MGADVCIAVNTIPHPTKGVETVITRVARRLNWLNPFAYVGSDSRDMPNMLDILLNSIQTLSCELGDFKTISADVRIRPRLDGFTWADFDRPLELIEKGAEAAQSALPEIRRVLAERN
jgi:predicted acylesterase/phospholipase RssA